MQAANASQGSTRRAANAALAAAALVSLSLAHPLIARAEGLDGAAVASDAIALEIQHCNN